MSSFLHIRADTHESCDKTMLISDLGNIIVMQLNYLEVIVVTAVVWFNVERGKEERDVRTRPSYNARFTPRV